MGNVGRVLGTVLRVNAALLRGEESFPLEAGGVLTGIDGVELGSLIVQLLTANSFMGRLVMRTPFRPEHLRRVLRDLPLGPCHMVEPESMIAQLLEVGDFLLHWEALSLQLWRQMLPSPLTMDRIRIRRTFLTSSRCIMQRLLFSSVSWNHFKLSLRLLTTEKLETTSEKVQMHCNFLFVNAHYFLGPIDSTPQWNALIKVYHLREAFSYKILMKVQRMVAEGHQIASHTWSHQNLTSLDATHFNQQMIYNEMAFNNILGYFPTYMRYVYSYESIINFYADM